MRMIERTRNHEPFTVFLDVPGRSLFRHGSLFCSAT